MKKIYLDYAATTPMRKEVLAAMQPFFSEKFGNASSLHKFGQEARDAVEHSREKIAKCVGCQPNEIIFTSGGTESNNLAIKGLALANPEKKHIIVSAIEHDCIISTVQWLSKRGYEITFIPVNTDGIISPAAIESKIRPDTLLVSVMHANNEIGAIQDIEAIGKICKEKKVFFHTDAVQTFGKIKIPLENIDLFSASSHKIYGPKGVGILYKKRNVKIEPLLHGGGHEFDLRSGTENVAGIVGFAAAAELAFGEMNSEAKRLTKLRNYLIKNILKIKSSHLNGHPQNRLPNNANFYFDFIEGESLVLSLDEKGIAASTGSACSSKKLEPSHVLTACGLKPEQAHGSLRITLGKFTTKKDIDYLLKVLPTVVERLRKISPLGK